MAALTSSHTASTVACQRLFQGYHLPTDAYDEMFAAPGILRPQVLRVYVVATMDGYAVMPGGLTRVSASPDTPVVSMQQGGGSKDTWVVALRGVHRRCSASVA